MVPDQDADSATAGGLKAEGAFYVWTADEVDEVLGTDSERSRLFRRHYYVKPQGNADLSPRRCRTVPVTTRHVYKQPRAPSDATVHAWLLLPSCARCTYPGRATDWAVLCPELLSSEQLRMNNRAG